MTTDQLSITFAALADPTRRAILSRLSTGEASVTELAKPFDLSLPGISKHLKVLQRAGLIRQSRKAQWRPCRPGGVWRFVQRNENGDEFAFHGVHHDLVAPERIIATFEFEGVPGHVLLQTVNFEPLGQKTRLVEQLVFQSVADRDGMVASGMQKGSDDSMDRMAEILENLKAQRA